MKRRNGCRVASCEIGNSSVPCPKWSWSEMRAAERHSASPWPFSAAETAAGQMDGRIGEMFHRDSASATLSGRPVNAPDRHGLMSSHGRAALSVENGTSRVAGCSREPSGSAR